MSRRRLGPALAVVALGVAAGFYLTPSRAATPPGASPPRAVGGLAITVRDVDRSVDFYSRALLFEKVSDVEASGADVAHLFGVPGPHVRVVTMRLGAEQLELVEDHGRVGRQMPAETPRDERAPARIALAVNDIEQASLWLERQHIQRTPGVFTQDVTHNTSVVRAVSFEDPDGHPLEIVEYPAGQGDARWQRPTDRVFLGIDHAALVVGDTDESLRFYRDTLGLRVTARRESDAPGPASPGAGARSRITTLRGGGGPAIELFESLSPRGLGARDRGSRPTLVVTTGAKLPVTGAEWSPAAKEHGTIVSIADATLGFRHGVTTVDPDGHRVQLRASR